MKYTFLDTAERASILRVLKKFGPARIHRTMTTVCAPDYNNDGWRNCFLTDAVGGRVALDKLIKKHRPKVTVTEDSDQYWKQQDVQDNFDDQAEINAISKEYGIKTEDLDFIVDLFDITDDRLEDQVLGRHGEFFAYVTEWLNKQGKKFSLASWIEDRLPVISWFRELQGVI